MLVGHLVVSGRDFGIRAWCWACCRRGFDVLAARCSNRGFSKDGADWPAAQMKTVVSRAPEFTERAAEEKLTRSYSLPIQALHMAYNTLVK